MGSAIVAACQRSQRNRRDRFYLLVRPKRHDDESLAQYRWRFLRFALKQAVQLAVESEQNDLTVRHGMHFVRRVEHDAPILQVCYMKSAEVRSCEYIHIISLHVDRFCRVYT